MEQPPLLQDLDSAAFPVHSLPPFSAVIKNDRLLVFHPFPHVFEHDSHSPKGPHLQSIGHDLKTHDSVSIALPSQGAPPFFSSFNFDLVLEFSPLPHVFEQELHSLNFPHSQSTGQASILHDSRSSA